MAYCKFCGMDSSDPKTCQWCKRPIAQIQPVPGATTAMTPPPPSLAEVRRDNRLRQIDEEEKQHLTGFFVACGILVLSAAVVLFLRHLLFPYVIIAALLVVGVLLHRFRVIAPFEDAWAEAGIMLLLALFFPAFVVFLGYLIYGLITKNMDMDVVWLLGSYCGLIIVLEVVSLLAFLPGLVPSAVLMVFRLSEFVGLGALFAGWMVSSWLSPLSR